MKDMLDIIYDAFLKNKIITGECEGRIKYYLYPETADTSKPFITIRPMRPPSAANYASDKNLSYQFAYQIDVQSHDRKTCKRLQHEIKNVLEQLGFTQQANDGLDEYFDETKRFVDARRYFKTSDLHDTDY